MRAPTGGIAREGSRRPASIWRAISRQAGTLLARMPTPITNLKAKLCGALSNEMISYLAVGRQIFSDLTQQHHCCPSLANFRKTLADNSGAFANYIPELAKAIRLILELASRQLTVILYEVGDSAISVHNPIDFQSLCFRASAGTIGATVVEETIDVEPSGDAFNTIRLNHGNRPFNAMVNSARSLVRPDLQGGRANAFERIRQSLSSWLGGKSERR